jgi:phosphoglycerate dehydrogenase-like enzyme
MADPTPVAVCSRSFSKHPQLRRELQERYPNARFNDAGTRLVGSELVAYLSGVEKAIVALEPITADVVAQLPQLRVISKYGVGLDGLDLGALEARSVSLGWTGGVNRRSVAELVISQAIALLRHLHPMGRAVRAGRWEPIHGRELSACAVGIVGCGHVGKELARLLRPFGCRLLATDIRQFPEFYREHEVEPVDLDTLIRESDVVSLHVPLDASTRNLLSAERLARMKRGAYLINTARGGLVDEDALEAALRSGHLAGAAFDVLRDEPPGDLPLLQLDNFLCTPHIAGTTAQAVLNMGRAAIAGLDSHQPVHKHRGDWSA